MFLIGIFTSDYDAETKDCYNNRIKISLWLLLAITEKADRKIRNMREKCFPMLTKAVADLATNWQTVQLNETERVQVCHLLAGKS